jgi:hypothetical protein
MLDPGRARVRLRRRQRLMPIPLEHKPADRARAGRERVPRRAPRRLRRDRRRRRIQTEVFDVEGTHAAVRYRRMRLRPDSMQGARRRPASVWECNAQFLIEACDEILVRAPTPGRSSRSSRASEGHVRLARRLDAAARGARRARDRRPPQRAPALPGRRRGAPIARRGRGRVDGFADAAREEKFSGG